MTAWYHDATLTELEVLERDCLYRVPEDCERWPEDMLYAAELNLRRLEVYKATLTSD